MAEFQPQIFGTDPAVDGWAVKDVAEEFGTLTLGSLARLDLTEEVSEHRIRVRRERLEGAAATQVQILCEVMDGITRQQQGFEPGQLQTVLARSYGIGRAFAQMPTIDKVAPGQPSEWTILWAIRQEPGKWLQLQDDRSRFVYTEQARAALSAAYLPRSGCPILHIDVTNDQGKSSSNLFNMYWGMLTSQYMPY